MICGDYTYELLEDGGACIIGYKGKNWKLTVPAELDGHVVREIGEGAFFGCYALTSVTLPDSLTSIGANPFGSCDSLAKIDVSPDHPVFAQIDGVLYEKATKTLICYPKGKTGDFFAAPDGTLAIGDFAFSWCKSLTTVTLPEGLTSIGDSAFSNCRHLTAITLPEGLASIGDSAFFGCYALTTVTLSDGLTSIGKNAFSGCKSLTTVTLPDGLTSIGDDAFSNCHHLTAVTLPEGLTSIGDDAFSNCHHLTAVTLPEGLISIGDDAFSGCKSLTSVTLPEGLTSIGDKAFYGCESLASVTLPDSLTSIGANPFSGCDSLPKIDVSPDHPVFEQIDGVLYEKATRTLICCPAGKAGDSFTVPDGTLAIGDLAFFFCDALTAVTLPEGLTSIGDDAFFFCRSLTAVTLPDGLTSIGANPFCFCDSLAKIDISPDHPVFAQIDGVLYNKVTKTLICYLAGEGGDTFVVPEGILSIGQNAFFFCRSLTSITLPDSLTSIGEGAFSECNNLTLIVSQDSYACQYAIDNGLSYTYPDA